MVSYSAVVLGQILNPCRVLEFGGMICVSNLLYEATITKYRNAPLLMFVNPPTQINISNLISACTACLVEVRIF